MNSCHAAKNRISKMTSEGNSTVIEVTNEDLESLSLPNGSLAGLPELVLHDVPKTVSVEQVSGGHSQDGLIPGTQAGVKDEVVDNELTDSDGGGFPHFTTFVNKVAN